MSLDVLGFGGLRGTNGFVTDQRPLNWREMMLRLSPQGKLGMTALQSLAGSEATDDPEYNWWQKNTSVQSGDVTDTFLDAALSNVYVSGGTVDQILYLQISQNLAEEFRAQLQVTIRNTAATSLQNDDRNAKVVDVVKDGANSFLAVKLLVADTGNALASASQRVIATGDINPEGGVIPAAITYDPVKRTNFTQIHRWPIELTRTARLTRLRTPQAITEARMEALLYIGLLMEKAFWFGEKKETLTGTINGQPERTSQGYFSYLREHNPNNESHFGNTDTDFDGNSGAPWDGNTWVAVDGGQRWLDEAFEKLFRYVDGKVMAMCGSGALLGIQRLAKAHGQLNLTPQSHEFGVKTTTLTTPFGDIELMTHPLFSEEDSMRNTCAIFMPQNVRERHVSKLFYKSDDGEKKAGQIGMDGIKEEYLVEMGSEFHHEDTMMTLHGFGTDNAA